MRRDATHAPQRRSVEGRASRRVVTVCESFQSIAETESLQETVFGQSC